MATAELRRALALGAACALAACAGVAPSAPPTHYGFGKPATPAELAAWDSDVEPDGKNLPPGSGTVAAGRDVYAAACACSRVTTKCDAPVDVGDEQRWTAQVAAMRAALSPDDQVDAVSGYVLYLNGLVGADATIDGPTLPALQMPNRNGFTGDPRPDVANPDCLHDCGK